MLEPLLDPKYRAHWRHRLQIGLTAPPSAYSQSLLATLAVFLVTSTGRTGTTWLADLLNAPREGRLVVHEPVPWEQIAHVAAINKPHSAMNYVERFRCRDMAKRVKHVGCREYGEVNGPLRRHVPALRRVVPSLTTIHLVRNGRDVVTSILNRATLTKQDFIYTRMRSPTPDVSDGEWASLDRFSKIAWMWRAENAFLRQHCAHLARLEDITTSYAHFESQILEPLGLAVKPDVWQSAQRTPRNPTRRPIVKRSDWTAEQERRFERICSEEMAHYGYE